MVGNKRTSHSKECFWNVTLFAEESGYTQHDEVPFS